ncbi:MAG: multicopper oxidase family protein [Chromatiales bacterium]|jgi:FtsP/CotA-like multicopper oxidase with cupredoxin domain
MPQPKPLCSTDLTLSRRGFLALGAAALVSACAPGRRPTTGAEQLGYRLEPGPARLNLVGPDYPATALWSYNGSTPGPVLRVRRGQPVRIVVQNRLEQPTTVHWHGIRLPNAMDGVPHLTQPPIAPGGSFVYEFAPPDAGTFWYHPHVRSYEQVDRGLHGALIVEDDEPIAVDRELIWVLDDWRLTGEAEISEDFGSLHDRSHAGRLGNTVTINGRVPNTPLAVRSGERLRLRLINASNARSFGLSFEGLEPWIIAIDGQPVEPHRAADARVVLSAATRLDLVLDLTGAPGTTTRVVDSYYPRQAYLLTELAYTAQPPLRERPPETPIALRPNPIAEPDLASAQRHEIVFAGGARGGMQGAMMNGQWTDIRSMAREGVVWSVNGVAATGMVMEPMFTLRRGRSYVLAMRNDTAFEHPIHLHGHHFRVLSRNGEPVPYRPWQDTVLMAPGDEVEVALVAENPGDWLFHCHILEHHASGMTGVIRVA